MRSGSAPPILDTNVARVLFRVFIADGRSQVARDEAQLWRHSEALVPFKHVFDFNQALMDLGATVCTARGQKCGVCPMRRFCRSVERPARGNGGGSMSAKKAAPQAGGRARTKPAADAKGGRGRTRRGAR